MTILFIRLQVANNGNEEIYIWKKAEISILKCKSYKKNEHNSYVLTAFSIDKAAIRGHILFKTM